MCKQQVKQVIALYPYLFPYNLHDCLVVDSIDFTTELEVDFKIYRVQVVLEDRVRYIDLITDSNHQQFLGVGGYNHSLTNIFDSSKSVCESLSLLNQAEIT